MTLEKKQLNIVLKNWKGVFKMEKVKINQEQAEAIREWKYHTGYPGRLLELRAQYLLTSSKCLQSLSLDKLARAIYVGYEVEEEFKENDWVVNLLGTVFELSEFQPVLLWGIRHATEHEIAEEKERRRWSSHGREVWELETEDILIHKEYGEIVSVKDVVWNPERILIVDEWLRKEEIKDDFKVICFKENRLDGDNDE